MSKIHSLNYAYYVTSSCHTPGSLLVAGAHFGGFGMGADIDYLLLHGRGKLSQWIIGTETLSVLMYWCIC